MLKHFPFGTVSAWEISVPFLNWMLSDVFFEKSARNLRSLSIDSIGAAGRLRRPRSCVQKCRRTCGRGEAGGVASGWCYKHENIYSIPIENGYL